MEIALALILAVLGLIIGSFLGAFTYRYTRGISIAKGRSICPKCKKQIAWYDNIPLISFLLLCGKCRFCKKPISSRYFLIEFLTAFLFVIYSLVPIPYSLPFILIISTILMAIFVIDWEHQIIPDTLVWAGLSLTLIFALLTNNPNIFPNLFAGFASALFLLLINLATHGRGMGLGDVKLAILIGTILGIKISPAWLFLAFLTGAIYGIILILGKKAKLQSRLAFGPFLIIAFWLCLLLSR